MPVLTSINLLALIDPDRDADGDGWVLSDGHLRNRIEPGRLSHLQLPYSPPAEYDLTIRYRRLDQMGGMVGVILPYDGTQVIAYLSYAAWAQKKMIGFGLVDRLGLLDALNPTRVEISGGDSEEYLYHGIIQVRKNRIRIDYEGTTSEWTPVAGDLSLEQAWQKVKPGTLALASGRGATVFEQVLLQPLSGAGEGRRPPYPIRESTPRAGPTPTPP